MKTMRVLVVAMLAVGAYAGCDSIPDECTDCRLYGMCEMAIGEAVHAHGTANDKNALLTCQEWHDWVKDNVPAACETWKDVVYECEEPDEKPKSAGGCDACVGDNEPHRKPGQDAVGGCDFVALETWEAKDSENSCADYMECSCDIEMAKLDKTCLGDCLDMNVCMGLVLPGVSKWYPDAKAGSMVPETTGTCKEYVEAVQAAMADDAECKAAAADMACPDGQDDVAFVWSECMDLVQSAAQMRGIMTEGCVKKTQPTIPDMGKCTHEDLEKANCMIGHLSECTVGDDFMTRARAMQKESPTDASSAAMLSLFGAALSAALFTL